MNEWTQMEAMIEKGCGWVVWEDKGKIYQVTIWEKWPRSLIFQEDRAAQRILEHFIWGCKIQLKM